MGTLVSSTNKTDRHDRAEILLKVALSTISLTLISEITFYFTDQRRMKGYQYYVISLVLFVTFIFAQRPRYKDDYYNKRTNKKKKSDKPNIIVIMTDDQDEALGKNVQIKLFKTYQFINFVASLAKFK
jgi:hypothetical protein